MAMENKRIIQLNTERTTPVADDYVMVDSATAGTAKYLLPKITDAIDQEISDRTSADTALQTAITNETTARANADTTLQGNITAEATARAEADTAINGEITQLKEDLIDKAYKSTENIEYTQGGISTTGSYTTASNRIRASRVLPGEVRGVIAPGDMSFSLYAYENDAYIGRYVESGMFSKSNTETTKRLKNEIFALIGGKSSYKYCVVLFYDDDRDITPDIANDLVYYYATDKTLSTAGKSADAKAVGDADKALSDKINLFLTPYTKTISNYNEYPVYNAIIDASRRWRLSSDYKAAFIPVPVGVNKHISIIGNANNTAYVSFLTSDAVGENSQSVTTWATGYTSRIGINSNESYAYDLPEDCAYVFVHYNTRGSDLSPSITITCNMSIPYNNSTRIAALESKVENDTINIDGAARAIALNADGHDIPQNYGIYNAYRKAKQMTDIRWTAQKAIPGRTAVDAIGAGDHIGLPYSSVKEYNKYVGINVSFRTFMTAAHNPYSLLYTEDVLGSRSKSEYGITYHGQNCGAYFGIVCSVLSGYALDWKEYWSTDEFAYLNKSGVLKMALDQSAYGMRRGDLIWEPGHVNIIIDIERDGNGVPTAIYWAESISYFPRIHAYTIEQANTRLAERGGIVYYYPDIYKNTAYEKLPFVAVGSETAEGYTYNDDICTYAGDYACFNNEEDVYINYTAGIYTQMQVYKDDMLLDTINIDTSAHAVKIETSGYGMYKARLTDGVNYSDYTYFEIVDTNVSSVYSGESLLVNFSSENSIPLYAQLTYRDGTSCGVIQFTAADVTNGNIVIEPYSVLKDQHNALSFSEKVYIKVFFKGNYGITPNAYLDTGIVA